MGTPIFAINDGTDRIDLLSFLSLKEYRSSVIEPDGGGVWGSSAFADGRVPIFMQFGNMMIEAQLSADGCDEDDLGYKGQRVRQLLQNAVNYWLSPSLKKPVWVEIRGSNETNIRYAYIFDYRAPGTGNPFAAPEFDSSSSMIIFPLVLETTPWQNNPLGSSDCIETSSLQSGIVSSSAAAHWHVNNNNDDVSVTYPDHQVYLGLNPAQMGSIGKTWTCSYYTIFRNIPIPQGATIISAFVRYTAGANCAADTCNLRIHAQRRSILPGLHPSAYGTSLYGSNYDNCIFRDCDMATPWCPQPRIYTYAYTDWNAIAHWAINTTYDTPSIVPIVQELVNLGDWEYGCDIAIRVQDNGSTTSAHRDAFPFETGSKDPELHITYTIETDAGRSATCTKEVIISNKHNRAQITHVFRYDQSAGTYTELIAAGWPQPLFPFGGGITPAVGDCLYIGINIAYPNYGPFWSIVYDLSQACRGITFTVTASTGGPGWAAPTYYSDNTNNLSEIGVSSYHFQPALNFHHQAVNLVNAWWIKLEITAIDANYTVPIQQNRNIYTITNPFFDIDHAQVKGDLPVLARTLLYSRAHDASNFATAYPKKVYLATRRLSRGEDFTPFLNASGWQHPNGLSYGSAGANLTVVEDNTLGAFGVVPSPTGQISHYDPGVLARALQTESTWTFAYNIAKQYAGRHAAYIRCMRDAGSNDHTVALQICYGSTPPYQTIFQTKTVFVSTTEFCTYIDTFSIMEDLMEDDYIYNLKINLMIGTPTAGVNDLFIYDVALMPVDEFVYAAETDNSLLIKGYYLDIDPIGNPKTFRSLTKDEATDDYVAPFTRLSRGPWVLNPRTTQRVWYFTPGDMHISHAVQQFGVNRYFDLRGKD